MAFFKIEKTGCSERKGLCQVRFDLFLEEGDPYYDEFYIMIDGEYINTPFCSHFCQFEPNVTDEEILYVGELALLLQGEAFKKNKNLERPINLPVKFSMDDTKRAKARNRVDQICGTDFAKVPIQSKRPYSVR